MKTTTTPEMLEVKTFNQLISVRSLTGIMRLNEHHFNNNHSTMLTEQCFTIEPLTQTQVSEFVAELESMGYLVEVRENKAASKVINAYLVNDDICVVAVVFSFQHNKLTYYGYSTTKHNSKASASLSIVDKYIKPEPIVVNYVTGFTAQGDVIIDHREIDFNRNKPDDSFYPFIEEGVNGLTDGFIESNSNLLLLIGPRGTGKTTLLREFCRRYTAGAIYQMCGSKVILSPNFDSYLAKLPEKSLIIIEDADDVLEKRTNNNTSLSLLLNELDGVASKQNKFVITTNLENLKSVDDAMLRVGRCYKTIAFRSLTGEEAKRAADALGVTPKVDSGCSLAELFNGANQKTHQSPGFSLR